MNPQEATAEVFWTAFQALSASQREAVIERLVRDNQFREDLVDIVILEQRKDEPSRPLEDYLADKKSSL
jgi:hypothetical protein